MRRRLRSFGILTMFLRNESTAKQSFAAVDSPRPAEPSCGFKSATLKSEKSTFLRNNLISNVMYWDLFLPIHHIITKMKEYDMSKVYDLIIIGAGPAGLSAGLYGGRARMDTLLIEKSKDGGQIATTDDIENYPGIVHGESGPSLIAKMTEQVKQFGAERVSDNVVKVELKGDIKKIYGEKGEYHAKAVIVATGAVPRLLGVPGEKEYTGKGVSYCATCDAAFFEDFEVYVVGAGDSAIEEAMFITRFARKVTVLVRGSELTAAKSIREKAFKNEKIEFMFNTSVTEIKGEDGLMTSIVIQNNETKEQKEIFADEEDGVFGLFVFIGFIPSTGLFEGQLDMERGYIIGDEQMRTNIPGVYVAGDCRVKTLRQVVTACADGAIAATDVEKYLESLE